MFKKLKVESEQVKQIACIACHHTYEVRRVRTKIKTDERYYVYDGNWPTKNIVKEKYKCPSCR